MPLEILSRVVEIDLLEEEEGDRGRKGGELDFGIIFGRCDLSD